MLNGDPTYGIDTHRAMARPDCERGLSSRDRAVCRRCRRLIARHSPRSRRRPRHARVALLDGSPATGCDGSCNHVVVCGNPVRLLLTAQRQLWPRRAALAIGTWTGRGGSGLLKLCPFLVPPFRSLFLNRNGDFLPGTPRHMAVHCRHRLSECAHDVAVRCREINSGIWQLLRYHIWRSAPVRRAKDQTAAAALLALAMLLRWCAYPHRRFFAHLHGDHPLYATPPLSSADSTEVVCFRQPDNHWDPEAISQLTALSDARWLVWHIGSGPGPIDELLPLFDDSATFAVSRQSSFRAWKPMLLPTAPFRTLQPGECTRIMAPLGSTIVLDRRKLETLGIPDVSHPITAFLLLFWKSAAAGWICYSVGQEKRLEPEPDFPSEETAFLLWVALAPDLRALGPRDPLLVRGNIAFSAGRTPIDPSGQPAPQDPGRLPISSIPTLARRSSSHLQSVPCVGEPCGFRPDRGARKPGVGELREAPRGLPRCAHCRYRPGPGSPGDLPEPVRRHECPTLRAVIADVCRSWRPNLVQFEYTQTAALRDAAGGIPAILVEHDITFSLYGQLAETEPCRKSRREYQRWLTFENHWLAAYDAVWTMSEADRCLAIESGRRDPGRTFCVPNGVDTERFRPRRLGFEGAGNPVRRFLPPPAESDGFPPLAHCDHAACMAEVPRRCSTRRGRSTPPVFLETARPPLARTAARLPHRPARLRRGLAAAVCAGNRSGRTIAGLGRNEHQDHGSDGVRQSDRLDSDRLRRTRADG